MTDPNQSETVAAFREAAQGARPAKTITDRTFALPRFVIFPTPEGVFATRTVQITVTESPSGADIAVWAHAAPAKLAPEAPNDEPAVQIEGDVDWIQLPDDVAALFLPPIEE